MIIEELSGRHRQSPIVLGGEGQSLGTKDILTKFLKKGFKNIRRFNALACHYQVKNAV